MPTRGRAAQGKACIFSLVFAFFRSSGGGWCDYLIDAPDMPGGKAVRMTDGELPDWDRIVERHAKRVFRVAMRILRSVQDAEDVSQDVFTEAFQLHKAGPVQSWTGLLVRLATLRSLDRLRRNRPSVNCANATGYRPSSRSKRPGPRSWRTGCERPLLNCPTSRPRSS